MVLARLTTLAVATALLGGCSGDSDPNTEDEVPTCGDETRYEEYFPGWDRMGAEGTTFVLDRAIPGPPEKGDNAWTMTVEDADGNPVEDMLTVRPFMPDHGHGSPVDVGIAPTAAAGEFEIDPLVFNMGGFWEIDVAIVDADDVELDTATFGLCIQD